MRRPRLIVVAAASAVLCGCSQPHPTLSELEQQPGATATYPGAVEYVHSRQDATPGVDGPSPASITIEACSQDAQAKVTSYFDQTLTTAGYTKNPGLHRDNPGLYIGGVTWIRGNTQFDLNFDTPENAAYFAQKYGNGVPCPMAYQTRVQARTTTT